MAEVIGLISALGGIAAAGLKVAKTIYSLADELGTAGARVKALATDTRALSFVCKSVKSRLERAKSIPDDGLKLAHEIGMLIKDEVDEIGSILEPLTSEDGKRMSKTQKAKWMFTKSQIATRQVALDSLKGTLNLLLAILNFNEGEEDRDFLQGEVEHTQSESEKIKTEFLNAERTDQALGKAYTMWEQAGSGPAANNQREPRQLAFHEVGASVDAQADDLALARLPALFTNLNITSEGSNMELVHIMSDDQLMTMVMHMKIQKKVLKFANDIVHRRQDDSVSNESNSDSASGYEILSDPEKRKIYDHGLEGGAAPPPEGGPNPFAGGGMPGGSAGFDFGGMPGGGGGGGGGARTFHFSTSGGPGGFNFSHPEDIFAEFMRSNAGGGGGGDEAKQESGRGGARPEPRSRETTRLSPTPLDSGLSPGYPPGSRPRSPRKSTPADTRYITPRDVSYSSYYQYPGPVPADAYFTEFGSSSHQSGRFDNFHKPNMPNARLARFDSPASPVYDHPLGKTRSAEPLSQRSAPYVEPYVETYLEPHPGSDSELETPNQVHGSKGRSQSKLEDKRVRSGYVRRSGNLPRPAGELSDDEARIKAQRERRREMERYLVAAQAQYIEGRRRYNRVHGSPDSTGAVSGGSVSDDERQDSFGGREFGLPFPKVKTSHGERRETEAIRSNHASPPATVQEPKLLYRYPPPPPYPQYHSPS